MAAGPFNLRITKKKKKKKVCLKTETKLQFYMVYMEENFFPRFFADKTQKSSLVFHTVLWTTVFHPILLFLFFFVFFFFFIEQGFACNSVE